MTTDARSIYDLIHRICMPQIVKTLTRLLDNNYNAQLLQQYVL